MKAALLQLNVSDDPVANLPVTQSMVAEAVENGAQFVLTPEVTNCVSASRERQDEVLCHEEEDTTLRALAAQAAKLSIWLLIGSLAIKTRDPDGRFANRSFLISPTGEVTARYDKVHMFDVTVSASETYKESAAYRPGDRAVIAEVEDLTLGLSICYDLRFPHLYRRLAQAGAQVLTVPSAFSPVTGAAHWESLLRARAIETGCYVLAPAQCGTHRATKGRERHTYGHSLAVSPWGDILAMAGEGPVILYVDLDPEQVNIARRRIPSLMTEMDFSGPE